MANLWFRTFNRTSANDIDTIADAAFLAENFTDTFGQLLQHGGINTIFTFNDLLLKFFQKPEYIFNIYCVADGGFIPNPVPTDPIPWFDPHVRFIAAVQPAVTPLTGNWVIFIVGSSQLNAQAGDSFLQVASWDPRINEYRYYAADLLQPASSPPGKAQGWIYQGRSSNAVMEETSYLGPFNGHVNGALVMKELQRPWYHWHSGMNQNLDQCFSKTDQQTFMAAPYLTGTDGVLFSMVSPADDLQLLIQNGINKWFTQRCAIEFPEPRPAQMATATATAAAAPTDQPNPQFPRVIQRWMSHILLTTTINIATANANPDRHGTTAWVAPLDHFINNMMLHCGRFSDLLPEIPSLAFDDAKYQQAATALGLYLIQENPGKLATPGYTQITEVAGTLGGSKSDGPNTNDHYVTDFVKVQAGEGVPFVILQPSYEDARGALEMQTIATNTTTTISLLSDQTFNAIMMLDIWNPVYSWRRAVLMWYVPKQTTWSDKTNTYDLEATFIKNVQDSEPAKDPHSPESVFLQLLGQGVDQHRQRISAYLSIVSSRLGTVDGLRDYLSLAESRRRVYRPVPLDEFGYTLPYALSWPAGGNAGSILEMTELGTTQEMPDRGKKFLVHWINTLWGDNPRLIPNTAVGTKDKAWNPSTDMKQLLDDPILVKLICGRKRDRKPSSRCPMHKGSGAR